VAASHPLLTRSQGAHIRELLQDTRLRNQTGAFVVEGAHAVHDLLTRHPEQILTIVSSHGYLAKSREAVGIACPASSTQQYSCPDHQFCKLSDLDSPPGILAVVKQPTWNEDEILRQPSVLGIYGEQLQDPANVGAIIRTAAALDMSALWLSHDSVDVFHPKVVRATSGVLLALPIFSVKDLSGLMRENCRIFAAEAGRDGTISIDKIQHVPQKCILAVGNESRGLSPQILGQAALRFTIPLSRNIDSLNVAATVAIVTFYFSRLPKQINQ